MLVQGLSLNIFFVFFPVCLLHCKSLHHYRNWPVTQYITYLNIWGVLSRNVSSLRWKSSKNPIEGSRSAPTRSSNQSQSVIGWQWGNIPWKHSPYIQVSDVLCYKPTSIIERVFSLYSYFCVIRTWVLPLPCVTSDKPHIISKNFQDLSWKRWQGYHTMKFAVSI